MTRNGQYFENLTTERVQGFPVDRRTGERVTRRNPRSGQDLGMYEYMLLQDLGQSLPYGRGLDKGFQLQCLSEGSDVEELIVRAIPSPYSGANSLTQSFRHFLQIVTFDLVWHRLYLEIEYFYSDKSEAGRPSAFKIHVLPYGSISNHFGRHYRHYTDEFGRRSSSLLSRKNLLIVRLPSKISRKVRKAISVLRHANSLGSVASSLLTGRDGAAHGFDANAYNQLHNDLVLKETREIGWAGRDTFLDGMLDPDKAWRAIQFARFQVIVRNTALSALHEVVNRASREIGFIASMQLSGVMTEEILSRMETDLQDGTRPIIDLIHPNRTT